MRRLFKGLRADVLELIGEFGFLKLALVDPLGAVVLVVETFVTVEPLGTHFLLGKRHGMVFLWAGNVWSVLAATGVAQLGLRGLLRGLLWWQE